jgi:hypothetical protein
MKTNSNAVLFQFLLLNYAAQIRPHPDSVEGFTEVLSFTAKTGGDGAARKKVATATTSSSLFLSADDEQPKSESRNARKKFPRPKAVGPPSNEEDGMPDSLPKPHHLPSKNLSSPLTVADLEHLIHHQEAKEEEERKMKSVLSMNQSVWE